MAYDGYYNKQLYSFFDKNDIDIDVDDGFNYAFYKYQNDLLKKNIESFSVLHIDKVDFKNELCFLNNGTSIAILQLVDATIKGRCCVNNPSSIINWKGFSARTRYLSEVQYREKVSQFKKLYMELYNYFKGINRPLYCYHGNTKANFVDGSDFPSFLYDYNVYKLAIENYPISIFGFMSVVSEHINPMLSFLRCFYYAPNYFVCKIDISGYDCNDNKKPTVDDFKFKRKEYKGFSVDNIIESIKQDKEIQYWIEHNKNLTQSIIDFNNYIVPTNNSKLLNITIPDKIDCKLKDYIFVLSPKLANFWKVRDFRCCSAKPNSTLKSILALYDLTDVKIDHFDYELAMDKTWDFGLIEPDITHQYKVSYFKVYVVDKEANRKVYNRINKVLNI